jgi:hypothetical protein
MALQLTTAPTAEPILLAEAKARLRIDVDDEDALLTALIAAARMFVEKTLGVALITQSWSYFLDFWPAAGCITLPILRSMRSKSPTPQVTAARDDVPGPIKQALKLLVAHWFERREPVVLGLGA